MSATPSHRFWWVVVLYSAAIFAASSSSGIRVGEPSGIHFDKVLHFGAFALYAILFSHAWARSRPRSAEPWRGLISVVWSSLYGLSDELHQGMVPGRQADPLDLAADFAGAVAGAIVYAWWRRRGLSASSEAEGESRAGIE